jgi:peptidoglycan hydrolase CwlO-like protein
MKIMVAGLMIGLLKMINNDNAAYIIEKIDGEETNLSLHVKLCEQRYNQLLSKFDSVDAKFKSVEVKFDNIEAHILEVKEKISSIGSNTDKTYLKWAGVIIITLLGIVIHFVTK